jgi:putative SOS response-associated peptidase YedK
MCTEYEPPEPEESKDEFTPEQREKFEVYGQLPHSRIRPTDPAPIWHPEDEPDRYRVTMMNWGWLVPWDKKPLVNARSETIITLHTFKPFLHQRCLIPAATFTEKRIKFRPPGVRMFSIAGLWREEPKAGNGRAFTMLTTAPNETVAPYHHRMPFLLRPDQYDDWLRGDWENVLAAPDKRALEKIQKQPELF